MTRSHRPGRAGAARRGPRAHRIALAAMLLPALAALPARALDAASLRAILFQRARAESLGVPLVLLSHETRCEMLGNGRRTIDEDWVWYIGDPRSPLCAPVEHPRLLLETGLESFGLRRCRIFRDRDTLRAETSGWSLGVPDGWACHPGGGWSEARGELPALRRGDVVYVAYTIRNQWARDRLPSDWQVLPITQPGVPTFDRSILVPWVSLIEGQAKVIGDSTPLVRHWGEMNPLIELHTGDLPPGPADPTALGAPRILFTASGTWESLSLTLAQTYQVAMGQHEGALTVLGDSLARTYVPTRARLGALYDWVEKSWGRVPRSLTAGRYYPQWGPLLARSTCTDRLDRALLLAGGASAARLRVDVFLARPAGGEPFLPDLPTPYQFDRVLLQVALVDEDRSVLFDPWEPTLDAGIAAVTPGMLLLGVLESRPGFFEVKGDGTLQPRSF
jgi:hypothetical protein